MTSLLLLFVAIAAQQSFAVKVTSSGIQRKVRGNNCTFRWTVDEPITTYAIYNRTTGYRTPLDRYSYREYDTASGVITLVLLDVQLWDAGNYSLELTTRSATIADSTACLFVYVALRGSVTITSGSNPAKEGDTVELTCNLTSASLPASYRTYVISYAWNIPNYGLLRNISSGPAVLLNGDLVPGYAIKNNGKTLRISSVRYQDGTYFHCYGLEDGLDVGWRSYSLYLALKYRPYIPSPDSKKFNVAIGKQVEFSFFIKCDPPLISATNWTFTDTTGFVRALPQGEYLNIDSYYHHRRVNFNLTSSAYYGNYSIAMANVLGSTTFTFQVLQEGPPEQPSNARIYYASHSSIAVRCNRKWSNSFSREQTVFFRLRLTEGGVGVDLSSISYTSEDYNEPIFEYFTKNIQPEMDYTVSIWSLNRFGSSDIVELKVRTRRQPKLKVSPETISINGTQAVVDFTVEVSGDDAEQIARVDAQCCSVITGQCRGYSGRYSGNQVVVDGIPDGTAYYIDLTVYSGVYEKYTYFSDSVRGLRVSRNGNEDYGNESLIHQKKTAIVLMILLGITLLALLVVSALCLAKRIRRSPHPNSSLPMFPAEDVINNSETAKNGERKQFYPSNVYQPDDGDPSEVECRGT